jgi:short-subunit dehydrogenase
MRALALFAECCQAAVMDSAPLTDRCVLVVGATGGLGRPISAALASAGARLTLHGRDASRLESLSALGDTVTGDISRADTPRRLVEAALEAHGRLDGIVYAAGIVAFGSIEDTPDEVLIDLFTVDTLAPIRLLRAALPALRDSAAAGRDPFVAMISAVVAEQPMPGMAAYSAAKAALAAYDAAAARELRRERIRLLDIRPPHTETGLATRPRSGAAPRLPQGLAPEAVAQRIVTAITSGEKDVPSSAFEASAGV